MKKFVFGMFMMVALMVSCNKTAPVVPAATENDSTVVDSTVVDTTVVDTAIAVDAPDSAAIEKVTE